MKHKKKCKHTALPRNNWRLLRKNFRFSYRDHKAKPCLCVTCQLRFTGIMSAWQDHWTQTLSKALVITPSLPESNMRIFLISHIKASRTLKAEGVAKTSLNHNNRGGFNEEQMTVVMVLTSLHNFSTHTVSFKARVCNFSRYVCYIS